MFLVPGEKEVFSVIISRALLMRGPAEAACFGGVRRAVMKGVVVFLGN